MLEPLGQSQVLGYLAPLAVDHEIRLISFEKKQDAANGPLMSAMRDRLKAAGIRWTPYRYHKSPSALATAYDIAVAQSAILTANPRPDIIHARSYVPALMALPAVKATRTKFLFDIRGFWADERIEGGAWPAGGAMYRTVKSLEKQFFVAADHIVTLTEASARIVSGFDYLDGRLPPVTVIPTCADLDRFTLRPRRADRPFTFGYLGSVGAGYLFDETLELFQAIRDVQPDAQLLVVNRNDHELIASSIRRAGVDAETIEVVSAEHSRVPELVSRMDLAAAFYKPTFSAAGRAPTKLAEYLGCGVPCVGNSGVGDVAGLLRSRRVGVVMDGFDRESMQGAAVAAVALTREPDIRERCARAAKDLFSLETGVERYDAIYRQLSADRFPRPASPA
ncbi:glycosyltransferase [Hansschlegelia plantiphila]|uniref:Glycosyl transferase n=1 Tax=Hansschlegelia plantiphila TaxID=374655 RepID=A0A9W6J5Q8_9HYPH|nr:glycosyltransferase [Hansschlegelia plantiphila]GLK69710.1 glycosyl transferase [Hansschlegelia plantiphila]